MSKKREQRKTDHLTSAQAEELQGAYKQSDNRIPEKTKEKFALDDGDGVSTKRPQ